MTARSIGLAMLAFLGFVALSAVLRLESFAALSIDPDEGLYFLIARSMLDGHLPYQAAWDLKPVGIFVVFWLGQLAFGDQPTTMRLLSVLATATTSFLLFRIALAIMPGRLLIAAATGVLYSVYSILTGGMAANTELFYAPLVTGGFLLAIGWLAEDPERRRDRPLPLRLPFLGGLLLGAALQIKYVVVFEAMVLGVVWLAAAAHSLGPAAPGRRLWAGVRAGSAYGIGVLLPTLVAALVFWANGEFNLWLDANLTANLRNVATFRMSWFEWLNIMVNWLLEESLIMIAPAVLAWLLLTARGRPGMRSGLWLILLAWWIAGLIGIHATGRYFVHYLLQTLPAAAAIAGTLIGYGFARLSADSARTAVSGLLVVLILAHPLAVIARQTEQALHTAWLWHHDHRQWRDPLADAAAFIKERTTPGDYIYAVNLNVILYPASGTRWPTRYVFPSHAHSSRFKPILGFDQAREMTAIFDREPKFVVADFDYFGDIEPEVRAVIDQRLTAYREVARFGGIRVLARAL